MDSVITGVVLSGVFSLLGVLYASRTQARSQAFDTFVKAYEAVTEENARLRIENARLEQQIADLERQLARAYRNRPDTGPLGKSAVQ